MFTFCPVSLVARCTLGSGVVPSLWGWGVMGCTPPTTQVYPGIGGYPAYHTGYETFDLVDRIYDPEYKVTNPLQTI